MSVLLEKMSEEDYLAFLNISAQHHSEELMQEEKLTLEEAEIETRRELLEMLPQGLETANNHLFCICTYGENVGYIWFLTEESNGERQAFLCDFLIFEAFRRKGFGRAALLGMEEIVQIYHCDACVLFVEDKNEAAKQLYLQCGYQLLRKHSYGQYMKKNLQI